MKQNLTLSLEKDVIKKAKLLAAHHDTSVTALISGYIEKMATEDDVYQAAKVRALKAMKEGIPYASKRVSRDELHER